MRACACVCCVCLFVYFFINLYIIYKFIKKYTNKQLYYNLDSHVSVDFVCSFVPHNLQIYAVNPWLTYGAPLHRLREFGIPIKEMDLIDETKLSLEQARKVCAIMYV